MFWCSSFEHSKKLVSERLCESLEIGLKFFELENGVIAAESLLSHVTNLSEPDWATSSEPDMATERVQPHASAL
jgi:hypothetical protein